MDIVCHLWGAWGPALVGRGASSPLRLSFNYSSGKLINIIQSDLSWLLRSRTRLILRCHC